MFRQPDPRDPFVLQWHLTSACNLRCRHCYQETSGEPDITNRREVVGRLLAFMKRRATHARFHLAGGEPLLCGELLEVMTLARQQGVGSRILSNGVLVDERWARSFRDVGCLGVQISLEGGEDVHDAIRGHGRFQAALRGAHALKREGVSVTFSMTLHQENLPDLDRVHALACRHADRLYVSRLVPHGRGKNLAGLTPSQWRAVLRKLLAWSRSSPIQVPLRDPTACPWTVPAWKALRTPWINGCAAGWRTLTVESDGTLMPCRRMNLPLGHVGEDLEALWQGHEVLQRMRNRNRREGSCGTCLFRWVCGGCRALAPDPFGSDPLCPRLGASGGIETLGRQLRLWGGR